MFYSQWICSAFSYCKEVCFTAHLVDNLEVTLAVLLYLQLSVLL